MKKILALLIISSSIVSAQLGETFSATMKKYPAGKESFGMWFVRRGPVQMVAAKRPDDTVHLVEYRKPDEKKSGALLDISEKEIEAILKECGSGWAKDGENQWRDGSGGRAAIYEGKRLFVSISPKGHPSSLAAFRTEAPKEVPLRSLGASSKEFNDAYIAVERKLGNDKLQEVGEERWGATLEARKTKENPQGRFITEKEFAERLKDGEKFRVEQIIEVECSSCATSDPKCKLCRGRGKAFLRQEFIYLW